MNSPFFSIIIPTYNAGKTLRRCLERILQQTDTDLEIIVQDGGSTDNTAQLARSFDAPGIKFFAEPDGGIYDAMNSAIERSAGKWLLFLGSDDYLYETTVLADMRDTLIHTTARLVYGNVKVQGDTPWAKDGTIYRGEITLPELLLHNYSHQATFYHHSIFDNGHRYRTQYRVCADYDFNLFCTAKYDVQYVPVTVSTFVAGGMSSVETDPEFAKDKWLNTIRYFGNELKAPAFIPFKKAFKKAGMAFLKRGEFAHAWTAYRIYLTHKIARSTN